jgi:hypothetical protein
MTDHTRAVVESGAVELAEPKELLLARLSEPSPWKNYALTRADLLALFADAGMSLESLSVKQSGSTPADDEHGRLIAVLTRAENA